MGSPSRLPWVDHLRTFAIFLVVCMHACVTYSHVGDWYFMADRDPPMGEKVFFIFWQGHLQSFFMGLLFLLAGYFAHASLTRRGAGAFLRERLVRLGLPTLLYMLVIHPAIVIGLNPWDHAFGSKLAWYRRFVLSGEFFGESGPLWFAFALLLFCSLLVGWRQFRPFAPPPSPSIAVPPTSAQLWLFAIGLALATFLVRTVQPIGTNVLNFQLCFFPQYIAAFLAGLAAARGGWLVPLARTARASRAGWLGLIGGPILLAVVLMLGGPLPSGGAISYFGGWNPQAFGLAAWEQLTGVALGLGCLTLFARLLNVDHPVLRWLSDRSFAMYVLHAPVLVALTMLFRPLETAHGPFMLAALLTITGLLASYALADIAKRIPGLRSIL